MATAKCSHCGRIFDNADEKDFIGHFYSEAYDLWFCHDCIDKLVQKWKETQK